LTVKVCPAAVIVPEREEFEVFAATENPTVPLPLPEVPEVTVIQLALLVAAQLQPLWVFTFVEPLPPEAGKLWLVGVIE